MSKNKTFAEQYLDFSQIDWQVFQTKVVETLYMTLISMVFVIVIGFLLGLLLYMLGRRKKGVARIFYSLISILSNVFRSVPYIILLLLLMPLSKILVGSSLGSKAAIPSLIISAAPFFARLVETAFREVDSGVLEAADAMGATPLQKIWKVLIPESLPAILSGVTLTTVSMIGYTAMAGPIGGGGLGGWAYQGGVSQNKYTIVLVATVAILAIVFMVQFIGDQLVKRSDKR
ncbi:D-methionine transport system permease protein [Enterococcus sp. PF1-24]|uniref:methionine ABC transporter permease n=1 Tax=unclassified Enterococcus TaxID=2608891 RepID=UPI002475A30A|nr:MULTISPECIES: methionine ABC transporter permease [unclassified Enterococcus]MDH6365373.1 D-methionine transport system permease protein [Enterococcus sp. PFB1-1]MDH6402474.1 D-methionine transport system permease protein [Enterococcus sp. PF1-24]